MQKAPKISDAELEVMKIIWEYAPLNTNQIVDMLLKTTDWNIRTIQTLISRLEKKGAIAHKKEGRIFVYTPVIKKEEYINEESTSFLNKFYNGAINKMVLNFIKNNMLSENDIKELKSILNERK